MNTIALTTNLHLAPGLLVCAVTVSFGCILYCAYFNLNVVSFKLFCNVCMCGCVCVGGFCNVGVCMCGFCNVWLCVCDGVCNCGFCNVLLCVCVGFVMWVCVYFWACVCVGFVKCGCVYVWGL